MNARSLITLLVALGVAGLAAVMANNWISKRMGDVEEGKEDLVPVVGAAADILAGSAIKAEHIKIVYVPEEVVVEGSLTKFEDVVDRVATQPLYAGELLIEKRLSEHLDGSPLAVLIEPGRRALTVRVNDVVGVAGFLLPGSRIDMISIRKSSGKTTITETLLQNLKVLAVDQKASSDKNEPIVVRAITLEVTPKQAEIVSKATSMGKVQFTLRNPLDVKEIAAPALPPPPPVLEEVAAPQPAPKPQRRATGYRVDVIRGTAVSRTSVAN